MCAPSPRGVSTFCLGLPSWHHLCGGALPRAPVSLPPRATTWFMDGFRPARPRRGLHGGLQTYKHLNKRFLLGNVRRHLPAGLELLSVLLSRLGITQRSASCLHTAAYRHPPSQRGTALARHRAACSWALPGDAAHAALCLPCLLTTTICTCAWFGSWDAVQPAAFSTTAPSLFLLRRHVVSTPPWLAVSIPDSPRMP